MEKADLLQSMCLSKSWNLLTANSKEFLGWRDIFVLIPGTAFLCDTFMDYYVFNFHGIVS